MYYMLNENVYWVKGCLNSCLYDFNHSRLYWIDREFSSLVEKINKGGVLVSELTPHQVNMCKELSQESLLNVADSPKRNSIDEIKQTNSAIDFAWIEVTQKCNLKCIHCYNESAPQCNKDMNIEDYKSVINTLLKMGVKRIQLIGGEPFCHSGIKEMLDYVIGKFDFIEIFTNGTLVTRDWFDYFAKHKIRLALSVYSYDSSMHDRVTGQAKSWERTNSTIEMLSQKNIPYRVCNIIMKDIEIGERTNQVYKLSKTKDVVRMSGRASFSLLDDNLIRRKLITKETFSEPISKAFCQRIASGHNCFKSKIYISSDLDVFPCVMERRIKHDKLDGHADIRLDEKILNLTKDYIEDCRNCEFRYACFDCRPNSLSDNVFAKPWYCTYEPESASWIDIDEFIQGLKKKWETK